MSFLLDTNVVSEIRKKTPNRGVVTWFASVPADRLFLSVLVLGEIRQGIARLANLNGGYVLALQVGEDGRRHLRSLKTASL